MISNCTKKLCSSFFFLGCRVWSPWNYSTCASHHEHIHNLVSTNKNNNIRIFRMFAWAWALGVLGVCERARTLWNEPASSRKICTKFMCIIGRLTLWIQLAYMILKHRDACCVCVCVSRVVYVTVTHFMWTPNFNFSEINTK